MSSDPNNKSNQRVLEETAAGTTGTSDHNDHPTWMMNGHNTNERISENVPSSNGVTPCNGSTAADAAISVHPNHSHQSLLKSTAQHTIRNNMFRIICLDLPFIFVLVTYLSIHYLHWLSYNYLVPLNTLQYFDTHERDITYYHRICTEADQTTHDTEDLLVDIRSDSTSSGSGSNDTRSIHAKIDMAVQKMLRHGVTIIPNLISESTATQLRDYILEQNKINDHLIFVIENQFRWSFPIQVDQDPIIARALQEILVRNNPHLRSYLEAVMGANPAVIEFTAITQAYGAKEQFWHQDGTYLPRSFVRSFRLCRWNPT